MAAHRAPTGAAVHHGFYQRHHGERGVESHGLAGARASPATAPATGPGARLGVATREEVGIDTLLDRLRDEAVAADGIVVGHLQVGAWCQVGLQDS